MPRRVEILAFEGCPNAETARALVDRVARTLRIEPEVVSIRVDDLDTAERLHFLSSLDDFSRRRARRGAGAGAHRVHARVPNTRNRGSPIEPYEAWIRSAVSARRLDERRG
jgi:hypothetical protein